MSKKLLQILRSECSKTINYSTELGPGHPTKTLLQSKTKIQILLKQKTKTKQKQLETNSWISSH